MTYVNLDLLVLVLAVTKSGSNEIEGSVYTSTRSNKKFIGTKAGDRTIVPGNFTENITGFRMEPIVKDKLFFFETLRLLTILVLLLLGLLQVLLTQVVRYLLQHSQK
jgi:hypothetical protein